jgi:regulator of cell morphogenesis and NO signaling
MREIAEMTVGEVAAASPASAQVFEKYGIDFCCAGHISVRESCLARGLDLTAVLEELESAAGSEPTEFRDWQSAPLSELVDHIVRRHHAYLKEQLPRIQALIEELSGRDLELRDEVLPALLPCFRGMTEELEARLMQQETVLFPALRDLDCSPAFAQPNWSDSPHPVHLMMIGHDSTAKALSEIRRITAGYTPPDGYSEGYHELYRALRGLDRDLHQHFHLENNILFPRAAAHYRSNSASGSRF